MMPPDSSQSMSPLAGGLALHPDRTTLPDRKNVKDSQSDSTRDMRMRGDRITRTTYNRKNKNGIEGDVGSPQDPNLRTTSFLVSENMMRSEINSTWRERRNTITCWQRSYHGEGDPGTHPRSEKIPHPENLRSTRPVYMGSDNMIQLRYGRNKQEMMNTMIF